MVIHGTFIVSDKVGTPGSQTRGPPLDAPTVEATPLQDGGVLAGNVGCNRLVVESDCMEVVEVMHNGGNSLDVAAAIYEECTFLCHDFSGVHPAQ